MYKVTEEMEIFLLWEDTVVFIVICLVLETGSQKIAQDGLELTIKLTLAWTSQSSCLGFLKAGFISTNHYSQSNDRFFLK
jgi:hypothetical protein